MYVMLYDGILDSNVDQIGPAPVCCNLGIFNRSGSSILYGRITFTFPFPRVQDDVFNKA